jgi:hypothetical protein
MNNLPDIISGLPDWAKQAIAWLLLAAAVWAPVSIIYFLWTWGRRVLRHFWPKREGWVADCTRDGNYLDPNAGWSSNVGSRWSQMREMQRGDHYQLDLSKARVIKRVYFDTDEIRWPLKVKFEVKSDKAGDKWNSLGEFEGRGIEFPSPQKIKAFKVSITEPRLEPKSTDGKSPAWSIYNIQLTEVILFGKIWDREI